MDMELAMSFVFVLMLLLIIMGTIVTYPITRKLGAYLEQSVKERAALAASQTPKRLESPLPDDQLSIIAALEDEVSRLSERQAFLEQIVESKDR